mmetsp:Transcript_6688/g.25067  ORF Transcript_6688/g.25067 Transcript_6688/m.25067 type:complete len:223 (+) Transcript_6688:1038-1706(+)
MLSQSNLWCCVCRSRMLSGVTGSGSASSMSCIRWTFNSQVARAKLIVRRSACGSVSGSINTSSTPVASMASCLRMISSLFCLEGVNPSGSKCTMKTQTCSHDVKSGNILWAATSSSGASNVHGTKTVWREAVALRISSSERVPLSTDLGTKMPSGGFPSVHGNRQSTTQSWPKCWLAVLAKPSETPRPCFQAIASDQPTPVSATATCNFGATPIGRRSKQPM